MSFIETVVISAVLVAVLLDGGVFGFYDEADTCKLSDVRH